MNIAFLTDDEKQNAEINCPYKLNNKKSGTLARGFYPGNSTLSGHLHFDNERWQSNRNKCFYSFRCANHQRRLVVKMAGRAAKISSLVEHIGFLPGCF